MAKGKSRSRSRRQQRRRRQQRTTLLVVGGVVVLGVVGAILLTSNSSSVSAADSERAAVDPTIGPDDAPVTITEYGDFGCPSCRAWHMAGIREQIIATYGDQVRFEFKDFPVITAQSPKAAEAAQCALDQGLFWEYHDYVYENFQGLFDDDLVLYADQVGLDMETFERCLDSSEHRGTVRSDWQTAQQLGLPGTPSFMVNGQRLNGVPYYETFTAQIDGILASQ